MNAVNGTRAPPARLVNGCTYNLFLPENTEMYMILERPSNTSQLTYTFNWHGTRQQPTTMFSWGGQCCQGAVHPYIDFSNVAIYGDWAFKPVQWRDVTIWPFADDGKDVYHCMAACVDHYPTSAAGGSDLWITISSWLSYGSIEGSFSFSFDEHTTGIKAVQLAVVQELYEECCWPTQQNMPGTWTWTEHQRTDSTDPDKKPYCDWLPTGCFTGHATQGCAGWANFSTQSCAELGNVFCDTDGNVVRLELYESGLKCQLPDSLSQLTALTRLDLGNNRIVGTVPETLLTALPHLSRMSISRNEFTGSIPCALSSSSLQFLSLSSNFLTGTLPTCLPQNLLELEVAANLLTGTLPGSLGDLSNLVSLDVSSNQFTGNFPDSLSRLSRLAFLLASSTLMSGALNQVVTTELPSLIKLDVSHSMWEGTLPPFSTTMQNLRVVQVENNAFSGSVLPWFQHLQQVFLDGTASFAEGAELYLSNNDFSGPLPDVLYEFVYNKRFAVDQVDLGGNHFRCDPTTESWPRWALRSSASSADLSHVLGRCMPVPRVNRLVPERAYEGYLLTVYGEDFLPSAESTCLFQFPDQSGVAVRAAFLSATEVYCTVPEGVVAAGRVRAGDEVSVTVANFGDDYFSVNTVRDFVPATFALQCAPGKAGLTCQYSREADCHSHGDPQDDGKCTCDAGYGGRACKDRKSGLPVWAVALVSLVGVAAGVMLLGIVYLVYRERRGEPVFSSELINPILQIQERELKAGL